DLSGSMANKVGKAKEAALQFFKTANRQDKFFLVSFNDRAEVMSAFTSSVEDLQSRILSASAKGRTALFDAIYLGLSEMRTARNAKRALLIISDGGDNNSRYNERDIKRLVREADAQLYSIGIFDPFGYRSRTAEELNGPSLLTEVTELTGGRAFTVENVNELPDIATKIGAELPLRSKMTPMEMGTSSEEKYWISCSTLVSKIRKLSGSRPVTRRLYGSVTVTLTSARSTSIWRDWPCLMTWPGVSCFTSSGTADWAIATTGKFQMTMPKRRREMNGTKTLALSRSYHTSLTQTDPPLFF